MDGLYVKLSWETEASIGGPHEKLSWVLPVSSHRRLKDTRVQKRRQLLAIPRDRVLF